MNINFENLDNIKKSAITELQKDLNFEIGNDGVILKAYQINNGLNVICKSNEVLIEYSHLSEFFRGFRIYIENANNTDFIINETCKVEDLGLMVDCSRNAVPKIETVKKLIRKISMLGYTYLQLYTEDTFEVEDEPYFGHFRGRYSKEELKELDYYGNCFGIELMPCIQTLAHLKSITKWEPYQEIIDYNDILLVGSERTYKLIDNIFKTLSECFTSRKVNIGMDEAHMLGLGKYLDTHGFVGRNKIMADHLKIIVEICNKYGFQPSMWSDMFFRLAAKGEYNNKAVITEEITKHVPKEVTLIYWDYFGDEISHYDGMIKKHKMFNNPITFAGGAMKWIGFVPDNRFSMFTSSIALNSCLENGIKDVLVTAWGDGGGECSIFSVLPTLVLYSETLYGYEAKSKEFYSAFKACAKCDFDTFMSVDLANRLSTSENPKELNNSNRYILYDDCFNGVLDTAITPEDKETYKINLPKIAKAQNECSEFSYIFKTLKALTEVLEIKIVLGIKTRKAYKQKDLAAIKILISNDYTQILVKIKALYEAFKEQWFLENKPHGFDVQDIRFGGLLLRIESCKKRLEQFVNSEISIIDELEEDQLDIFGNENNFGKSRMILYNNWEYISTVNCLGVQ